ncbi:MAG: SpoIIE family protein phosphatase [Planctomycetes bacterium]|nr:SpoIIE family protein phosphatase [Planctomycetota bacterium]
MSLSDSLDLISRVTDKIVGGISVEEVLSSILDGATDLLRARRGSILLIDPATREMRMRVARGVPEEIVKKARMKVGEGLAGKVAATGEPLLLKDFGTQAGGERGYRDSSALLVPLKIKGEVLGVLNLNDKSDGSFDEDDLRLAVLIGNQASVALYNARLVESAREKERMELALSEFRGREEKMKERLAALELVTLVTDKLVASPDLREVLASLIEQSTSLVLAERGSILLFDAKEGALRIEVSRGIPPEVVAKVRIQPGEGLAGKVFATGEPLFLKGADGGAGSSSGVAHAHSEGRSYTTQSAMLVPLKIQGQVLGVLNLSNKRAGADFTEDDFVLARIVSNQASIAVYNAQLAASWVENQKMKQALEIAREIQMSFLPREAPSMESLEVAGWSMACDEIGGDYYDYIPLGPDQVGIAIGDVSGHGVGAALLMATARALLRAFASQSPDLSDMFFRVNNLLSLDVKDDAFMTLFLGAFDFRQRRLRYTSAGHDEPVHYRPSTGEFRLLESTGIPLGMLQDQDFPVAEVGELQSGDLFAFSTDGVREARNRALEQFGPERLQAALVRHRDEPAVEIVRAIHKDVLDYCGELPPHDDVSLVVVRVL